MFRTRTFIFRKTVVVTGMVRYSTVRYVLCAEITINSFHRLSQYNIFEVFTYIYRKTKHSS
jgi:hypothetical protein